MIAYINPMTGQQIMVPQGEVPDGLWCAIGEIADTVVPRAINTNDINMSVGNDFKDEDDEF